MRVVKASDIREWIESPIGELFREVLEQELQKRYEMRAQALHWGEAQRTQEERAFILGEETRIQDLIELLSHYPNTEDSSVYDIYFTDNNVDILQDEEEVEEENDSSE